MTLKPGPRRHLAAATKIRQAAATTMMLTVRCFGAGWQ
jgi:hypothetical protein